MDPADQFTPPRPGGLFDALRGMSLQIGAPGCIEEGR